MPRLETRRASPRAIYGSEDHRVGGGMGMRGGTVCHISSISDRAQGVAQVQQLRREGHDATNQMAMLASEFANLRPTSRELFRLRGGKILVRFWLPAHISSMKGHE
jgi:hypothetical protein